MRAKAWLLLLPLVAGVAMPPSRAAEPAPTNVIGALQARLDKGETKPLRRMARAI